ncbi:hypothetical protein F0562_011606 [Nyssa sinensis]|uniref:Uncharacterized protein n=1 Tax=Nyssa sinensis TaxID=561372 RepID=A0A5J4ZPX2_9ASTE|nr:hypothetical protein F0562_011606 [Nyssa sinensis]
MYGGTPNSFATSKVSVPKRSTTSAKRRVDSAKTLKELRIARSDRVTVSEIRVTIFVSSGRRAISGNNEGDGEVVVKDESLGELIEWDEVTHPWCW